MLARDRLGIRPLHYTIQNKMLLFASEIKSIFMCEHISREIDPYAMHQIFTFWTTLPSHTVFKNIHELPPGHFLKISKHSTHIRKYWDIPFYPPDMQLDTPDDQIKEAIRELLTDAIRIRLRADVPVGCYLSGGLDSSGVTTLVARYFNNKVHTFGICFEEEAFDESEHQSSMVSFLDTPHSELMATNSKIEASFPDVLWYCEKPLLRTAPTPLYLLSEMVNQHGLKVVLTGEGADEVFGGYNIFKEAKIRHFWAKQPHSRFRGLLIRKLYPYIFNDPRLQRMQLSFFAKGLDKVNDPFFSHSIRWENTGRIKRFFSRELLQAHSNPDREYEQLMALIPPSFSQWDYLAKAQFWEMVIFLSNYLLSSQGDRVAMGHSVEIRLPYFDYRIIDSMARVPAALKMKCLNEKYILKESFRGIVPDTIVNRPKHPYRAPIIPSLLKAQTSGYVYEMLSMDALKNAGLFDPVKVQKLVDKLQKTEKTGEIDSMAFVGILSSQIIYDTFIVHFPLHSIPSLAPAHIVDKRSTREN
ncbi:MAG: asparagine synthase (glutamine-hydrolyzing) [bacterium]